ncbi:MAG: glycosyltransferase family 2 protein [Desulfobacteraceae bacterium]|nr:MAG: glycosyltransferase family 2 protein [Desulfobacteraceae bacterium]
MEGIGQSIFWIILATLFYTYFGFPFMIVVVGILYNRRVQKREILPRISLVVAAHNEERSIAEKLTNALSLDYPASHLEILVASDGSSDKTEYLVSQFQDRRVRLLSLPRRGKIFALNDAVLASTGEILVFSDANTLFHASALGMLARNFADPQVGGVCGNQMYIDHCGRDSSSQGENLYWSFDKWLKSMESRTGNIVSADGAIYAIRRELYRMPSVTSVTDDFAISTSVIERGYRLVFEEDALAYEKPSAAAANEFSRKVRIINRGMRGVILRKALLNPFRYGFYSLILFSHKVLRRMVPLMLIALLVTSWIIYDGGAIWLAFIIAQILFYAIAITGYLLRSTNLGRFRLFYVPFYYCFVNAAALVALVKISMGKRIELWQPQR